MNASTGSARRAWEPMYWLLWALPFLWTRPVVCWDRRAFGDEGVTIQAPPAATTVDSAVMEHVVKRLADLPMVSQAYWSASTTQ